MTNKQLEPFQIFKIYHAMFLHFTSDYDYLKYNGKTSYQEATFNKRKDKYAFHKIKRALGTDANHDFLEYYIAWLFFDADAWVPPSTVATSLDLYNSIWTSYSVNRVNNFQLDMAKIKMLSGRHILDLIYTGQVHVATLLILNKFRPVIDIMNDSLVGSYLWDKLHGKLLKFAPLYYKHEPIQEIHFRPHIPETLT